MYIYYHYYREEKEYDRFFPTLESFCQPDPSVAPAPLLSNRQHKLVIVQAGTFMYMYVHKCINIYIHNHILSICI
jgi:hypothetical protein